MAGDPEPESLGADEIDFNFLCNYVHFVVSAVCSERQLLPPACFVDEAIGGQVIKDTSE